jgi:hypothetical protein
MASVLRGWFAPVISGCVRPLDGAYITEKFRFSVSVWVDDLVDYVRSNLWTGVRRKDLLVSPTCFEK